MEDKETAITPLIFDIANALKRSLETPVIYVTGKDYAEDYMKSLYNIQEALLKGEGTSRIAKIVNNFHLEWFQAIQEIEEFRKRVKETSRHEITMAITYTIECIKRRCDYFKSVSETQRRTMNETNKLKIGADLDIISDMQETVITVLKEIVPCFLDQVDQFEFIVKVKFEIEELLNWLDKLYNNLAIQINKVIDLPIPLDPSDLTKTLKEIIEEVAGSSDPKVVEIAEELKKKGSRLSSMVHVSTYQDLKMRKVIDKIRVLEDRISSLKDQKSSAVLALRHKVIYLEDRLQSLEQLKVSLHVLKTVNDDISEIDVLKNTDWPIFNHNLPPDDRCRLVEELSTLWEDALTGRGTHKKSIITILSQSDIKETFTDNLGNFTIDQYGRKIYTLSNDSSLYQSDENNKLVPLNDANHIYYYDECGRYYIDECRRRRIYKALDNSSEYELDYSGVLVKVREFIDGIEHRYDDLGTFYIDDAGRRIYCELETGEKYNRDSFGNIFKIRDSFSFEECPAEPEVTPEFKYLQRTVGDALKKSLANVILCQPTDPIAHLANNLVKYRQNMTNKQIRLEEEKSLLQEREFLSSTASILTNYVNENYDNMEEHRGNFDYSTDDKITTAESTTVVSRDL